MKIESINLELIDPPAEAHRLGMDEMKLSELAESMKQIGQLNPITVRPTLNGRYEIVAGHRRYCAARIAGWVSIYAIARDDFTDAGEASRFAENLQRADLTPMEEALAVTRLIETTDISVAGVAGRLNKSNSWVRNRVALMGIPDTMKSEVHAGRLSIKSAIELMRVTDEVHRVHLTRYAIEGGASATVIKQWVDDWEVHVQSVSGEPAPLPTWQPGDSIVIVQMPCAVCRAVHDHREMIIVRVCGTCRDALADGHSVDGAHGKPG